MGLWNSKLESYFLSDRESHENIYCYIDRKVQPDTYYLCLLGNTVDKVVQYLYQNLSADLQYALSWTLSSTQLKKLNVKKILKSGSLGKSTAVKEKSDIDLIIFLNGISSIQELSKLMPKILNCLKKVMMQLANDRSIRWIEGIEIKRHTNYSLGLILKTVNDDGSRFDCEMDLLPSLDITNSKSSLEIYREMENSDEDLRRYYSACLSPIQKEFVNTNTQPAKVKNLVRFLKFWAKVEDVPMKSYFVELLVIHNNRTHKRPFLMAFHQDFDFYDHLKECLQLLTKCEELKITFTDHYAYQNYGRPGLSIVPYVLDPANPFMNVAPSPRDACQVSNKAKEFLVNWDRIFT